MISLLLLLYLLDINMMKNEQDLKRIEGQWVLVDAKAVDGDEKVTGYWEFYGIDILIISSGTIQTYSFLDDSLVSDLNYAYNMEKNELNIFITPEPWQTEENTFSVTLKVLAIDENHLTLLYSLYNGKHQLYGEVMELHYVAIHDLPIKFDLLSLDDILSSSNWQTEEFTLNFSKTDSENERHYCRMEDGNAIYGLWYLHDIFKNKLLVLQKNPEDNDVYQIQSISKDQMNLIDLNSDRKIRLRSYF